MDRIPGSKERAAAVRIAALTPDIHRKLWGRFGAELPPDVVIVTYLMRDCGFNEAGAKNLVGEYRSTFEYAELEKPDNMPPDVTETVEAEPVDPVTEQQPAGGGTGSMPPPATAMGMPLATGDNDIKVLLDGDRLRVSAYVDLKGLKRLKKFLMQMQRCWRTKKRNREAQHAHNRFRQHAL